VAVKPVRSRTDTPERR